MPPTKNSVRENTWPKSKKVQTALQMALRAKGQIQQDEVYQGLTFSLNDNNNSHEDVRMPASSTWNGGPERFNWLPVQGQSTA